jgi:hypothetical protein
VAQYVLDGAKVRARFRIVACKVVPQHVRSDPFVGPSPSDAGFQDRLELRYITPHAGFFLSCFLMYPRSAAETIMTHSDGTRIDRPDLLHLGNANQAFLDDLEQEIKQAY